MTWVNAAIAVYGLYEGNRQRRAGERERRDQKAQDEQIQQQQQQRVGRYDSLALPMIQSGTQNMNTVQSYLQRLASGDRSLTEQTLAPQINQMTDQFRGGVAAQRNLMPRGGAGAAQSSMLGQQLQGGINNMMFGARAGAIGQLGQLGANQTSLGLGAMGQGAGLTNSMLQYGLDARNQQFNQGMAAGQGFMGMLDMAGRLYNQYATPKTAPNPQTPQQQQQPQGWLPGGDLSAWGKGSMLGFGGGSPAGTYSSSNNIYGRSS
jgi:hypothetical protein